jgi:hypothetical protein
VLVGRFGDTTGRPYIEGRLILPRLRLRSDFSFLVDTGADVTFLTHDDARVMNVDYSKLSGRLPSQGIGGRSLDYAEPALLVFDDADHIYVYGIDLVIAAPGRATSTLPSLLGRNILDRWDIRYCPEDTRLEAEVRSATVIQRIDGSFLHSPIGPDVLRQ